MDQVETHRRRRTTLPPFPVRQNRLQSHVARGKQSEDAGNDYLAPIGHGVDRGADENTLLLGADIRVVLGSVRGACMVGDGMVLVAGNRSGSVFTSVRVVPAAPQHTVCNQNHGRQMDPKMVQADFSHAENGPTYPKNSC